MENYLFFIFGILISCFINSSIIFQFIEERYERTYYNKSAYILLKMGTILSLMFINGIEVPILNMLSWISIFSIIVIMLYTENGRSFLQRVFEIIILILVLSICETVGYSIFEFILWKFGINNIHEGMLQCINMTFSKLVIIAFYYLVISRIWKPRNQSKFTLTQYIVHIVMIVYSIVNLVVIIVIISGELVTSFTERLLLLINMFCIVFADFYFIYFTKFTEENGQLKLKLKLLEQQSDLQYEYYKDQEEKYNESVKILHDVNKHLDMIKEIYELDKANEAKKYTNEIKQILQPLILKEYTTNPILNIILNDKKRCATLHNIEFKMEIGNIDLSFMELAEISTVFGNLLDNAIEACDMVFGKLKFINMKLDTYNDFIVIHVSNTSNKIIKWDNGKPISNKGKNHGIGLLNVESVIKKYNGSILLEEENGVFSCNIIFNS